MPRTTPKRVTALTPAMIRKGVMRRIRQMRAAGHVLVGLAVQQSGEVTGEDIDHLLDTGTITAERAVESIVLDGKAREYTINGLSAEGLPAKVTMEVRRGKGLVTAVVWF